MKYYDISDFSSTKKKDNIFVLTGEHPRELIAVEAVFHFIKYLFKTKDTDSKQLLQKNLFRINLIANPISRKQVEDGDYCVRGNKNNVDINRNWDYYWGKVISLKEENPGTKPFSEIETMFIKDSIKDFKAKMFLSLHSGEYTLFHPYAYFGEKGNIFCKF